MVGERQFTGAAFHWIASALAIVTYRRGMVYVVVSLAVVALCTWLHPAVSLSIGWRWSNSQGRLANLGLEHFILERNPIRSVIIRYTVLEEDGYIIY